MAYVTQVQNRLAHLREKKKRKRFIESGGKLRTAPSIFSQALEQERVAVLPPVDGFVTPGELPQKPQYTRSSLIISLMFHLIWMVVVGIFLYMSEPPQPGKPTPQDAEFFVEIVELPRKQMPKPEVQQQEESIDSPAPSKPEPEPEVSGPRRRTLATPAKVDTDTPIPTPSRPVNAGGTENFTEHVASTTHTTAALPIETESPVVAQAPPRRTRPTMALGKPDISSEGPKVSLAEKMVDIPQQESDVADDIWAGLEQQASRFPGMVRSAGQMMGRDFSEIIAGGRPGGDGAVQVAYILDISGSMQGEPLKLAKEALKTAIKYLNIQEDAFYMLAFNNGVVLYANNPTATPMTKSKETEVKNHIEGWGAGGGTNLMGSIDRAFSLPKINTILLISDGQPSTGITDPGRIRSRIRSLNNRPVKVKIHTVAISAVETRTSGSDLLEAIAKETKGKFQRINVMKYFQSP
jgi:Mg-chelatase subunit ChlD